MSDIEIMAAIGIDHQLDEDRPTMTKPKRSFMQKLSERHEALKLSMRSPKLEELDQEEQSAPSRTSSSSSAHKDFFKLAPVTWSTKTDRTRSEFAILYDNIADDSQPSPVFVQSPLSISNEIECKPREQDFNVRTQRQLNREASASDVIATQSIYSSYSTVSMDSSRTSTPTNSRPSLLKDRIRSLPCEMSDEQMDAWLERPEDAEVHRQRTRKHSASSTLSEYSPTMSKRYTQRRKTTATTMEKSASPVASRKDSGFLYERSVLQKEFEELLASVVNTNGTTTTGKQTKSKNLTLSAMPVEIMLEVTRHLDTQSAARCRQTCKNIRDTVPAPARPLTTIKT
jgi:hypothetical protein